jgi:serine/threonine-protein kinase
MDEKFGNYELLEKVAVGGMAEIFKARSAHGQGVEKLVCIKRIHPALSADKSFVAMFIDEARLGVKMVHGNIVPVFDFGYVDGHYFLAMEYVEGQDLAGLSGRAQVLGLDWPLKLAIYVTMEILEGLAYAHQCRDDQGRPLELVHRDVSPSNILVSNDGQVKLLDFGIARSQAREFETRTGVIKGKPGYMSPEQAAGLKVDARSDVWSCGAVLHELTTGVKIKDGRRKIDNEEIDALLRIALAADREERFQDARELQGALADVLAANSWRPNATDLAEFIERINSSQAPGENWDMQSTAVEEHLAAALESITGEEPSSAGEEIEDAPTKLATPMTDATPDPPTRAATEQIVTRGTETRGRARPLRIGLVAGLILAAGAAAIYFLGFDQTSATGGAENGRETGGTRDTAPSLETERGTVSIASDPKGAQIWLDGSDTGKKTPAAIDVAAGEHAISLKLPGFGTWTHEAEISPGQQVVLEPSLKALPATVTVTTVPTGAQVVLDGAERGKSPLTIEDVTPGAHKLVARMAGRIDAVKQLNAEPGGEHEVLLELKERSGGSHVAQPKGKAVLKVTSWPPGAEVTLDGRLIGRTPIRGRQIGAGKHKVVVTNPLKNVSRTHVFTVKAGETKLIKEQL